MHFFICRIYSSSTTLMRCLKVSAILFSLMDSDFSLTLFLRMLNLLCLDKIDTLSGEIESTKLVNISSAFTCC